MHELGRAICVPETWYAAAIAFRRGSSRNIAPASARSSDVVGRGLCVVLFGVACSRPQAPSVTERAEVRAPPVDTEASSTEDPAPPLTKSRTPPTCETAKARWSVQRRTMSGEKGSHTFKIVYPEFSFANRRAATERMNELVRGELGRIVDAFLDASEPGYPSTLDTECAAKAASRTSGYIGIACHSFHMPGAHPATAWHTTVARVCEDSIEYVELSDLCRRGTECEADLLELVNRASVAAYPDLKLVFTTQADAGREEVTLEGGRLAEFAVAPSGLTILLQNSLPQVLKAAGSVEVTAHDLKELVREDVNREWW